MKKDRITDYVPKRNFHQLIEDTSVPTLLKMIGFVSALIVVIELLPDSKLEIVINIGGDNHRDTNSMQPVQMSMMPSLPISAEIKKIEEDSSYSYSIWYLKAREGYVKNMYICPAGKRTIGYGHNIDAHNDIDDDCILPYHKASSLLAEDFSKQYNQIIQLVPSLKPHQARAVTCLALNIGIQKLMYTKGKQSNGYSEFWLDLINQRTPNFLVYNKYRTSSGRVVVSTHLKNARKFEQMMFEDPASIVKQAHYFRKIVLKQMEK
jgi:GH24 family phage-related lysozyme (muramidase)